jgi:hypothetical protein
MVHLSWLEWGAYDCPVMRLQQGERCARKNIKSLNFNALRKKHQKVNAK